MTTSQPAASLPRLPWRTLARRRRIKKRFNARLAASSRFIAADGQVRTTADRPPQQAGVSHLTPHQVTRHVLKLDDGQQVGLSVAGAGVPFVLLHGIGLHNRTYEQILSYLPEFGFLAVAIEAPGHGRSSPMPRGADFAAAVPAAVLHGAHDLVVPLADATAIARRLDAPLLTLRAGYHSWLLASPRTFAAIVAEIFADLTSIAGPVGRCFDPGALALEWAVAPARLLPPRLDETVLGWQSERPAQERPRRPWSAVPVAWRARGVPGLVTAADRGRTPPRPDGPRGDAADQRADGDAEHQVDQRRRGLLGQRGRRAEREHHRDHGSQRDDPGEEHLRPGRGQQEQVHQGRGGQRGPGG